MNANTPMTKCDVCGQNVILGRCDNCNYSEEVYFDGEKWHYRCDSLTSPMGGNHVDGNWSCKKFCEKGK